MMPDVISVYTGVPGTTLGSLLMRSNSATPPRTCTTVVGVGVAVQFAPISQLCHPMPTHVFGSCAVANPKLNGTQERSR